LYKNKKIVAGLSVMKKVNWEHEWLAEAYMETDYKQLKSDSFQKVINDYLSYVVKIGDLKND
jgi:type I restriction enzyme M protein